jgi:WD40 repeat protein/Tfp pilus assembly protein PilV
MNPDRRERVWTLFDAAADLPPGERAAFLGAACGNDADLRAEVESLLAHDDRTSATDHHEPFLKSPVVRPSNDLPATVSPGAVVAAPLPPNIGRYRILRELGSGGMGTVYEAEQDNPRRSVALKVIGVGLTSSEIAKRFEHEAQILGRLHHPGIAQIYEAGLTDEGRAYFAMELIRGVTLDLHVRNNALGVLARLALVARVCDAVQHAHDRGDIHRDLKPGNILVDETGQPKVLDFGVARATDLDVQTATGRTQIGQLVGTVGYMSPEQIAADPALVNQRSDVYALGVILFELLADRLPYNLAGLPFPEMARVIQDQTPSALGSVNSMLRGDVETIVAKALEKESARRYASAGELASDLRRHLNHEPIKARPPSTIYLLRKFARRHKPLVAGAVGIVSALVLGLIGTSLFAAREAEQRRHAEQNAQLARENADAAELNARLANDEKHAARYQSYRARLAAAATALQNHDVDDARRQLAEAPAELRGWEWHHLSSRLDDRFGKIAAAPGASLHLLRGPEGIEVGELGPDSQLRVRDLDGKIVRTVPFTTTGELAGQALRTSGDLRVLGQDKHALLALRDASGDLHYSRLSPDGSCLAQATPGPPGRMNLVLYKMATGERTGPCVARSALIWDLSFSPDSTRVASADDAGVVSIWNTRTGENVAACVGHSSKALSAAFRPDGKRLVTASADGTVRQWEWDANGAREVEPPYERHSGEVLAAVYSPDGEWIASAGTDRTIRVWRASGRQEAAVLHGHTGAVVELAFTPDGKRLVSRSENRSGAWLGDNTAGIWDVDFGGGLPVLLGHTWYVYPAMFSPDGRWIASGSWDRTLRIWDAKTGDPCAEFPNGDYTRTLTFSPDSTRIVSVQRRQPQIWDIVTRRHWKDFPQLDSLGHAAAFHPDGTTLAVLGGSGQVLVFDLATRTVVKTLSLGAAHDTKALAYSPDGRWLAGTDKDLKTVCVFDARTYEQKAQFTGHEGIVRTLAFSADGRFLASAGTDRVIRVWEVARGACRLLEGHTDEVFALAFHPDGTRLASGGRDRAVWIWDLATQKKLVRLSGHTSYVWSLDFSPDGKTLVSGSGDKTVRLWDTAPLADRYKARREVAALQPEAEQLVKRLFEEKKDADAVVAALNANGALSETFRRVALREVMRRRTSQRGGAPPPGKALPQR